MKGSNEKKPWQAVFGDRLLLAHIVVNGTASVAIAVAATIIYVYGCGKPDGGEKPSAPPPIPPLLPNVMEAIGKIRIANVGCSGTIIGPIGREDKTISILTAAHCVRIGQKGKMFLKDGRELAFECVSSNIGSDCAWLVAPHPGGQVPFALLAKSVPSKGSPVWHAGFGVDKPGNTERGTFEGTSPDGGQCVFFLSVSSGDSGGGIFATDTGYVLSPVCCTQNRGAPSRVWGSTPMAAAAIRPGQIADVHDEGREKPVLPLPDERWPETIGR